jgi:hypothetical protein
MLSIWCVYIRLWPSLDTHHSNACYRTMCSSCSLAQGKSTNNEGGPASFDHSRNPSNDGELWTDAASQVRLCVSLCLCVFMSVCVSMSVCWGGEVVRAYAVCTKRAVR